MYTELQRKALTRQSGSGGRKIPLPHDFLKDYVFDAFVKACGSCQPFVSLLLLGFRLCYSPGDSLVNILSSLFFCRRCLRLLISLSVPGVLRAQGADVAFFVTGIALEVAIVTSSWPLLCSTLGLYGGCWRRICASCSMISSVLASLVLLLALVSIASGWFLN